MKLENFLNKDSKDIIRQYNLQINIKGYSKMKKADLITEIKKHLVFQNGKLEFINNIKIKTPKPEIKTPKVELKENEKVHHTLSSQAEYSDLRFKYRNHPAMKINEEIRDIEKHLERGDYETKKEKNEAIKNLTILKNVRDSSDQYILDKNGLPKFV